MMHVHKGRLHRFLKVQIQDDSDGVFFDWPVEIIVLIIPESFVPNRLSLRPTLDFLVILTQSNAGVFVADKYVVFLTERGEIVVHCFCLLYFLHVRSVKEEILQRLTAVI